MVMLGLFLGLFFEVADFLLKLVLLRCQFLSFFEDLLKFFLLVQKYQFFFLLLQLGELLLRTHLLAVQLLTQVFAVADLSQQLTVFLVFLPIYFWSGWSEGYF